MKTALKLVYIALVGAVVFMGALYIAEGMRAQGGQSSFTQAMDQEEGSAL